MSRNASVGEGIDDNSLKLSVSDGLVNSGDVLADCLVVPTGHADVVKSLEVLLAVHLDFQLGPDILVHGPPLLEVLARWGGSVSTLKERLRQLVVEGGESAGEGGAELRDVGNSQGQWRGGREVVDERRGASLGDFLHPISTIHGSRFVERVHNGLEQLPVNERGTEVGHQLLLKDFRDPK